MRLKAIHTLSSVKYNSGSEASINGYTFTRRILGKNLENIKIGYPYIILAGQEFEKIKLPAGQSIMMLDLIKNIVVAKPSGTPKH